MEACKSEDIIPTGIDFSIFLLKDDSSSLSVQVFNYVLASSKPSCFVWMILLFHFVLVFLFVFVCIFKQIRHECGVCPSLVMDPGFSYLASDLFVMCKDFFVVCFDTIFVKTDKSH